MSRRRKQSNILFVDYFDEWVETYKEGHVADVTLQKYIIQGKFLRETIPNLKLIDLDRRQYQLIINQYAKTREIQTVRDFHHQVKASLQDAYHDELIDRDPTYKAVIKGMDPKKKKADKFLEVDELKRLIQTLNLSVINMDWFILIAAKTGLRFAEILALTPNDFNFVDNTLTVNKTWNYKFTKGGFDTTKTLTSDRVIGIDWQIIGQFKPLIDNLPQDEPIFVEKLENGSWKRVFNSTYNNYLKRKCVKASVPRVTIHSLRHTHASVLLAAGVSIHSISRRLGHADIGITQETYAHILEDLKQKDEQLITTTLMQIV